MTKMLLPRQNTPLVVVAPLLRPRNYSRVIPACSFNAPSVRASGDWVWFLEIGICCTHQGLADVVETMLDVFQLCVGTEACDECLRVTEDFQLVDLGVVS
jgi:hypothetical protein